MTSLSRTGEGNGNPLQCSCLENPRDGGAWWAAVYGVAKSQTRLKRLSSSSSSNHNIQLFSDQVMSDSSRPGGLQHGCFPEKNSVNFELISSKILLYTEGFWYSIYLYCLERGLPAHLRELALSALEANLFIFFIFKLHNIVLVLPYIKMNPPQAYMSSPS